MSRSEELEQALDSLARMYRALHDLKVDVLPRNSRSFAVLAEGPLEEIRRLEHLISESSGRSLAEAGEADLWLCIQGPGLSWPSAPSSVLATFLDALRKGVQSAAEWILHRSHSIRPVKRLLRACDFRVSSLRPGSVQVGVARPLPERGAVRDELDGAIDQALEQALRAYLLVACWVGDPLDEESLAKETVDPDLQRLLLTEIKRIAPRPRGSVARVELAGRGLPGRRAILTRASHVRIDRAIAPSETDEIVVFEGELREIDLDDQTFILRDLVVPEEERRQILELPCSFDAELLPAAIEALDRRVRVSGELSLRSSRGRGAGKLRVIGLVILEEEGLDSMEGPG